MINKIEFRSSQTEDLSFVMTAEKKAAEQGYVVAWTKEKHLQAMARPGTYHEVILNHGEPIGYVIMNHDQDDNLELMRIVITEPHKGYGQSSIKAIQRRAFKVLKCNRLWLDVRMHNTSAIRLYEHLGFVQEGILRQCVKYKNDYISVMVMSILKEEYEL